MAGLAALLSFGSDRTTTQTLLALSHALAPRGAAETAAEYGPARLLIRSELPVIHEIEDCAVIVDGIAEVTSLVGRYLKHGPAGLLQGDHPYAMVLADVGGLMLCRHLDGPPLYYARCRGAVVVASEPAALLAAGVPAVADENTVTRFLASGTCDEVPATFFQGIRRVLPGQVVEVTTHTDAGGRAEGWAIRAHPPQTPRAIPAKLALLHSLPKDATERTGVALAAAGHPDIAMPTAALLGAALMGTNKALPVYSASFPGLTAGSYAQAVLGPLSSVRHRAIPLYTDEFDVDGYVSDLGEPAPGLWGYLLWAISKATAGETDALVSATGWNVANGHVARLADRIAARYGVMLRFPYRDVDRGDSGVRHELQKLAERSLPSASLRAAAAHAGKFEAPVAEVLQRLRAEIAGALLYPKDSRPDHTALTTLSNLDSSPPAMIERLWRRYVLERWLATVVSPAQANVPSARPASSTKPVDVSASGRSWQRRLLQTESFGNGDRLAEKVAWYVGEFATSAEKPVRQALRHPWYLLVAAKPVAVVEGQARAIWEIEPGRVARTLVRVGGQRVRHTDPWSMQAAIDAGGLIRVTAGALSAAAGQLTWYRKLTGPKARSVSPPREHACPPAHLAVISPPGQANGAASEIISAMRRSLPEEIFVSLQGCAIVSVDASGARQLGWAGLKAPPAGLIRRLCEGNPFGQGDERTPLLLALGAAAPRAQAQPKKGGKRQPSKRR